MIIETYDRYFELSSKSTTITGEGEFVFTAAILKEHVGLAAICAIIIHIDIQMLHALPVSSSVSVSPLFLYRESNHKVTF